MGRRKKTRPGAARRSDVPLFSIGVVFAGFPRQPFTIQVTQQRHSLDQLPVERLACLDGTRTLPRDYETDEFGGEKIVRFFRAVRRDATPSTNRGRYLRTDDPDLVELMRLPLDKMALWSAYINAANEIQPEDDLRVALTASPTQHWVATSDDTAVEEIHVLVVLGLDNDPPGPLIGLFRSCAPPPRPGTPTCFGGDMDKHFYVMPEWYAFRMRVARVVVAHSDVEQAAESAPLPLFDHVRISHSRCVDPAPPRLAVHATKNQRKTWKRRLAHWHKQHHVWFTPQQQEERQKRQQELPRLAELAENVVFHRLLTQEAPAFLDPIDCIVDASLYRDSTLVCEKVLCFVKFQRYDGEQRGNALDPRDHRGLHVSSRMLETLDAIARLGNATRPRLLLFVATDPDTLHLDKKSLPALCPAIVVDASKHNRVVVDGPQQFVGNMGIKTVFLHSMPYRPLHSPPPRDKKSHRLFWG